MSIKEGSMERLVYIGEFRYLVEAWYSDDGGVHATVSEIRRNEQAPIFASNRDDGLDIKRVLAEATDWTHAHYGTGQDIEEDITL